MMPATLQCGAGAASTVTDVMRTSGKARSDCSEHNFDASANAENETSKTAAMNIVSGMIFFISNLLIYVRDS
jgi:hypothetical protein